MEYSEYPSVEGGVDRRLVFPHITWLSKARFEQIIEECKASKEPSTRAIQPYLENNYSPSIGGAGSRSAQSRSGRHQLHEVEKRIYVGKTIPKAPWVHHPSNSNDADRSLPFEFTEMIGNVFRSDEPGTDQNGTWKIKVTHNGYVFDLDDNFLVLQIKDPDAFFWSSNVDPVTADSSSIYFQFNIKEISNYALRASVDKEKCEYNYIGRTIEEDEGDLDGDQQGLSPRHKRPKFFSNGWYHIGDRVQKTFGKVKKSYKLLFAPSRNMELGFDQFETLCLKASPASLKVLCRSVVRSTLNYSQKNIKSLKNLKLVPKTLVNFLEYPSHLKLGEFLLKDEKLVREDDSLELAFDQKTGDLVVCQRSEDSRSSSPSADDASSASTANDSRVIAQNVDLVWLHTFQTVFYNQKSSRARPVHSIYDKLILYNFLIDWEKGESLIKEQQATSCCVRAS